MLINRKAKKRAKFSNMNIGKDKLVVYHQPKNPVSEVYRTIRTNIQFSAVEKEIRTLTVTSATEGEGKTTTIANLAVTLAQQDNRVLILDADLRRPKVHKVFDVENDQGLTEILVNKVDPKSLIKETFVENLFVLPTGVLPPNPAELLGSKNLVKLIEELKESYDYVLIDVPPVNLVADGLLIANIIDGVLLVCSSGVVPVEEVKRAKELLVQAKARILGVILNNVPMDTTNYYYYY